MIHLKAGVGGEPEGLRTARERNKWVLEQIKPESLLEAKMTKPKLPHSGHIMRSRVLWKRVMLGKTEDCRQGGRPNLRWINSGKEAIGMSLEELSRAAEDRTLWTPLTHKVTRNDREHTKVNKEVWQVLS